MFYMNAEDAFVAAKMAPITEIMIGDRSYPFGILSPEQHADISAWGERIADSQKPGGIPLKAADRDPSKLLKALLRAGDPTLNFKLVLPHAKPEHVLIANDEYLRQACIAALGRHEGSA